MFYVLTSIHRPIRAIVKTVILCVSGLLNIANFYMHFVLGVGPILVKKIMLRESILSMCPFTTRFLLFPLRQCRLVAS